VKIRFIVPLFNYFVLLKCQHPIIALKTTQKLVAYIMVLFWQSSGMVQENHQKFFLSHLVLSQGLEPSTSQI
jgi:hypothetical protein